MQHTLKSGINKGNRRIWIEGNRLSSAGFARGTVLYRTMTDGQITLSTVPADGRKHKIAGTPERPILDLCGKWVTDFMGTATHFCVTVYGSRWGIKLTICPKEEV